MPDYWKENFGGIAYDELGARRVANTIKLRSAGIATVLAPASITTAATLLAAYLAAAATTEKAGDLTEAKRRTGN